MADNTESIGGIGVTISGDYSDLAASFTSAQADAAQAGEKISEDGTAQCVDDRWHAGWCHDVRGHRLGERYLTAHAPAHKVGA